MDASITNAPQLAGGKFTNWRFGPLYVDVEIDARVLIEATKLNQFLGVVGRCLEEHQNLLVY